jgi:3-dehydroquinate synthase
MSTPAPGAFRRCRDRWGAFERCAQTLAPGALCLVDKRVLQLHPRVGRALHARAPAAVVTLEASERTKSLEMLTRLAARAPRTCSGVIVIGGGTLGDLGTVLAHLIRRGVPLTQVPTTLLAAVDSSVGGKGAVHVRNVKNAWGVFHYPHEAWLCPELWTTLTHDEHRQGAIEAFKMNVCLERGAWKHRKASDLVKRARRQKERVCQQDPYDSGGLRRVLNFGHTFGHAFESLSGFTVPHGDAVALGMLCVLDIGQKLGVTPAPLAAKVERTLAQLDAPGRPQLARLLRAKSAAQLAGLIAADKKGASLEAANVVLLEAEGRAAVHRVARKTWEALLPSWR